ncbi:hypothetical protein K1T71_009966 [Dendrolimus kikuchii]|uniref:Uncharacterized protein n=1 Tax=Dendrolimus kikuchii TaxID=765133 RepID=A0ACC1CT76_9NEOP|nr:hypothetical protein K1T71_009966 [Dendrolimus kikuchii]
MFLPRVVWKRFTMSYTYYRQFKNKCLICKNGCIDKPPQIICRVWTRSMTKSILIYETYRCMPLLGDENEKNPDWEIHIVKYTVVFKGTLT